jgi:hypothetical protein
MIMGSAGPPRKKFIQTRAKQVRDLDGKQREPI